MIFLVCLHSRLILSIGLLENIKQNKKYLNNVPNYSFKKSCVQRYSQSEGQRETWCEIKEAEKAGQEINLLGRQG